ncbi:MAG: hypothetical protein LBR79_05530 [Oscillospiraceae bacterium]|nr:hypothetical protein [Oscillospiraceae bacterium]
MMRFSIVCALRGLRAGSIDNNLSPPPMAGVKEEFSTILRHDLRTNLLFSSETAVNIFRK